VPYWALFQVFAPLRYAALVCFSLIRNSGICDQSAPKTLPHGWLVAIVKIIVREACINCSE
jgi:hypothetical protein